MRSRSARLPLGPILWLLVLSPVCQADDPSQAASNFAQSAPVATLAIAGGLNKTNLVKVDAATLAYRNRVGTTQTTQDDLYLTAYTAEDYPIIIDRIQGGFDPELSLLDLDQDGSQELLVHYHMGAHSSGYRIYEITYDGAIRIKAVDSSRLFSGFSIVNLAFNPSRHRYQFTVEDKTPLSWRIYPPPHTKHRFTTRVLAFVHGKVVLVSQKSRVEDD